MTLPPLNSDIALASFKRTFPRRKEADWEAHEEEIVRFRLFLACPGVPARIRRGFLAGLAQWSESFAERVARN